MNDELLQLFLSLDAKRQTQALTIFQDSPKTIRLIELLKSNPKRLKTLNIIRFIYQEELEGVDQSILINRFYKLRQNLKEWLLGQLKHVAACFIKEEQELAFLRMLVTKSEYAFALGRLKTLEEHCWAYNIFELLPEIIQLILRSIQSIDAFDTKQQTFYEDRLWEAMDLQRVLQQLLFLSRRSFSAYEVDAYKKVLEQLKKTYSKHKHIPRFVIIYHFTAFSRGVFIPPVVEKASNALSRHLNKILSFRKDSPNIPIQYYEANFGVKFDFDLALIKAIFALLKDKTKLALQEIEWRQKMRLKYSFLAYQKSESEYRNIATIYIANGDFDSALQTIQELLEFYEQQQQTEQQIGVYVDLVNVYAFGFPDVQCPNPDFLLKQLDKGIDRARSEGAKDIRRLASLLNAKSSLCLIMGRAKEAYEISVSSIIKAFYKAMGMEFREDLLISKALYDKDISQLKYIKKYAQEQLKKCSPAQNRIYYRWMVKVCTIFIGQIGLSIRKQLD